MSLMMTSHDESPAYGASLRLRQRDDVDTTAAAAATDVHHAGHLDSGARLGDGLDLAQPLDPPNPTVHTEDAALDDRRGAQPGED